MYEPKDTIIQRMSAQAADLREGLEAGNNDSAIDLLDTVEEFLAQQEEESEDGRERGVIVVFDVTSRSHHEGARGVAEVLSRYEVAGTAIDHNTVIESWWFPEAGVKHVDGNDNADMTLVRRDLLGQLVDAHDNGDAEWLDNVVHRLKRQVTGHAL